MTKLDPYFGEYGGMYVPQILMPALKQLETAFLEAQASDTFKAEFSDLLNNYAGRPTALTLTRNLSPNPLVKIYLKREDLLHGGAHKTNQVLGQALLAKRMGKKKLLPKRVQVNTALRPPLHVHCSILSVRYTWGLRISNVNRPTSLE